MSFWKNMFTVKESPKSEESIITTPVVVSPKRKDLKIANKIETRRTPMIIKSNDNNVDEYVDIDECNSKIDQYDNCYNKYKRESYSFVDGKETTYPELISNEYWHHKYSGYRLDMCNGGIFSIEGIFPIEGGVLSYNTNILIRKLGLVSPAIFSHYPTSLLSNGIVADVDKSINRNVIFTALSGEPTGKKEILDAGFTIFKNMSTEELSLQKKVESMFNNKKNGTILMGKTDKESFNDILSFYALAEALHIRRQRHGEDLVHGYQNDIVTELLEIFATSKERILALIELVDSVATIDTNYLTPEFKKEAEEKIKAAMDRTTVVDSLANFNRKIKEVVENKISSVALSTVLDKLDNL